IERGICRSGDSEFETDLVYQFKFKKEGAALNESLTIDEIKVFLEVVNAGSITGASKNLFISQPSISQHIKNIEEKLNFKLFDRSKSEGLILTEKGFKVYQALIPLINTFDETMETLFVMGDSNELQLKIGASKIIGEYMMPEVISDFFKEKAHSNFCVEIQNTSETIEKILDERVAFGLIETPFCHSSLFTETFCVDEMKLICSSKNELASKREISLEELKDVPFIFREIGSGTRKMIEEEFAKYDFTPKIHLSFSSNEAIKRAVANDLGVSILSEFATRNEEKAKTIVSLKIKNLNFKREFYISRKKGKFFSEQENEIIEFLKEWAKSHLNDLNG
ncbi:MAG: LysR family transcriptional regulator, partial [Athalassotoga sp.]